MHTKGCPTLCESRVWLPSRDSHKLVRDCRLQIYRPLNEQKPDQKALFLNGPIGQMRKRPKMKIHNGASTQLRCFVFLQKIWLPVWLHSSCLNSPTAVGTCQKCSTKYHGWVDAQQCTDTENSKSRPRIPCSFVFFCALAPCRRLTEWDGHRFAPERDVVIILIVGLSYGARNVLSYTRHMIQRHSETVLSNH